MPRHANPTDGGAIVLSVAMFTKAGGLPLGVRSTLPPYTIEADGRCLGLTITIDTRDPDHARLILEHEGRRAESGPRALRDCVERTAQPFGGVRWWFRCPHPGIRATSYSCREATLFCPGKPGACFMVVRGNDRLCIVAAAGYRELGALTLAALERATYRPSLNGCVGRPTIERPCDCRDCRGN
jgi:hypothetical protein